MPKTAQNTLSGKDLEDIQVIYDEGKETLKKAINFGYKINKIAKEENLNWEEIRNILASHIKKDFLKIVILTILGVIFLSTRKKEKMS